MGPFREGESVLVRVGMAEPDVPGIMERIDFSRPFPYGVRLAVGHPATRNVTWCSICEVRKAVVPRG